MVMRGKARRGGMHKCLSGLISSLVNAYLSFLHCAFSPCLLKLHRRMQIHTDCICESWACKMFERTSILVNASLSQLPPILLLLLLLSFFYLTVSPISHTILHGPWTNQLIPKFSCKKQLISKLLISLFLKQVQWIPQADNCSNV